MDENVTHITQLSHDPGQNFTEANLSKKKTKEATKMYDVSKLVMLARTTQVREPKGKTTLEIGREVQILPVESRAFQFHRFN